MFPFDDVIMDCLNASALTLKKMVNAVNTLTPRKYGSNFKSKPTNNTCYRLSSRAVPVKLFSCEWHRTPSTYWTWQCPDTLTYGGRDKMAVILQMTFSNAFFNENAWMLIKISLKFVPKGPISIGSNNGLAMTRRQAIIWINGGWITDAYMHHSTSMSWRYYRQYTCWK